jgi:drug/metabolite transporter (DMT)-like permease
VSPWSVLLPLLAAVLYVLGALLIKRAAGFGLGVWRTTFVCNLTSAVVFTPLLCLGGTFYLDRLWQPAVVALLFLVGQVFTFLSLGRGDVSVATPVLGVKIILVAFFTTLLLADAVPMKLWLAAGLSTLAVALLNFSGAAKHHHVGITVLSAMGAATAYALFDVLVQKWSPAWGIGRFLPVMLGFVAVYTLGFVPLFRSPLSAVPRGAWRWLLGGALLLGLQGVVFISAFATYRNATTANIVYSSRGLWSVLAVWLIGHWFANTEQHLGAGVLRWRLAGAALMMAAIVLVLLG